MSQPTRITCTLLSIGVVAVVASLSLQSDSNSSGYGLSTHGDFTATPGITYPGPSENYATTPYTWSLNYAPTGDID